jgi:ubiquinone/menaquinone biosynthesis C-methylase UbiE
LLVAAGTGIDFQHLPPRAVANVIAIDLSSAMLERARRRVNDGPTRVSLVRTDALRLPFQANAFDTVLTSCTMCSVPRPAGVLREIHRVLRHDGRLLMFEHVRSRHALLGVALDAMSVWTRLTGTEMNRDTLRTVRAAGFRIESVESVFLDVIIASEARKART